MAAATSESAEFRIGPLTHYAEPAALRAWFASAPAGGVAVYATGPFASTAHPVCALAREWYAAGQAELFRQRSTTRANSFDYQVRKLAGVSDHAASPSALPPVGAGGEEPIPHDAEQARLLELLRDAAERGRACPSSAGLAVSLRLPSSKRGLNRVQYLLGRLVRDGWIAVESRGRNAPRAVTVLRGRAQGKRTEAAL